MADTIRGAGLFMADAALAALVSDPSRLDRARNRFSHSPPSYRSQPSGATTRSQNPNPPSEEQRPSEDRKWPLMRERKAPFPSNQFAAQASEEYRRLFTPAPGSGCVGDDNLLKLAIDTVKKRWVEQGIWNDSWKGIYYGPSGGWKHEEPLEEFGSESETDSQAQGNALLSHFVRAIDGTKWRRPRSDEELRLIAERRLVREREREASRPFHQFVYQISKERERIQGESGTEGSIALDSADINTKAYENVKNMWIRRGIWNGKWGILPGMSWKHEQPLDEMLKEEMGRDPAPRQANPLEGDGGRSAFSA